MKTLNKKLLAVLALVGLLIGFLLLQNRPCEEFVVLKVENPVVFWLDFNKNGLPDDDEKIELLGIKTFNSSNEKDLKDFSREFNFTQREFLRLKQEGEKFAGEHLEGKTVKVKYLKRFKKENIRNFAVIELDGEDWAKTLLRNGLALPDKYTPEGLYYLRNLDMAKVLEYAGTPVNTVNYKIGSFVMFNKKSKIFHRQDCEFALKLKNYDLLPEAEAAKIGRHCKICHKTRPPLKSKPENINQTPPPNQPIVIEAAIPNVSTGAVGLYFINPNKYVKPVNACRTNACQAILKHINEAKESIDIAIYEFEGQKDILNALIEAQNRNVKVRGLVNQELKGNFVYPDAENLIAKLGFKTNRQSWVLRPPSGIMHNKIFIFDEKIVITGSMNISNSGAGGYNSNTAVIISDNDIVQAYMREFSQMYDEGRFGTSKTYRSEIRKKVLNDGSMVSLYFTPDPRLFEDIAYLIKNASKEITVNAFVFTYKPLAELLVEAKSRGVKIRVMLDAVGARSNYSAGKFLRENSISVKTENWGGKNHEKTISIDGRYLIAGSMNFSAGGFSKNDENVIIFDSPKLTEGYKKFFELLWQSIPDKYLTQNPDAEGFESGYSCFDGIDNDYDGKIDAQSPHCKR